MANIQHKSIGSLQKGQYCVIDGHACTVVDLKISRPGKHGHAKANLTAVGIIDGKKRNIVQPGHDHIEVPVIEKKNCQALSVSGDLVNVMDNETYETFDLKIPEDMKADVKEGQVLVYWIILHDKVLKGIKNESA